MTVLGGEGVAYIEWYRVMRRQTFTVELKCSSGRVRYTERDRGGTRYENYLIACPGVYIYLQKGFEGTRSCCIFEYVPYMLQ